MPMNAVYQKPDDLADVIPVFPLPGALLCRSYTPPLLVSSGGTMVQAAALSAIGSKGRLGRYFLSTS